MDVCIIFDITGSMSTALSLVRKECVSLCNYLFDNIPNLNISSIKIGDYCDGKDFCEYLPLSNNRKCVVDFLVKKSNIEGLGGDAPEAYEYAFNVATKLNWHKDNKKIIIFIGDDIPHKKDYRLNKNSIDWEEEVQILNELGVKFYAIQALGRKHADWFYDKLSSMTNGLVIELSQFAIVKEAISACIFNEDSRIEEYKNNIESSNDDEVIKQMFDNIIRKQRRIKQQEKKSLTGFIPVHPSKFQILKVEEDISIKDFVIDNGLKFKTGKGFYEFTKTTLIQKYKQVVIRNKQTLEMFTGDEARKILGVGIGIDEKVSPKKSDEWEMYIQSTSNNRKLLSKTKFLYEVEEEVI